MNARNVEYGFVCLILFSILLMEYFIIRVFKNTIKCVFNNSLSKSRVSLLLPFPRSCPSVVLRVGRVNWSLPLAC